MNIYVKIFFVVILIIGIILLYKFFKKNNNKTWPKVLNNCPDYWLDKGNYICENTYNLGKCPRDRNGIKAQGDIDFKKILNIRSKNPRIVKKIINKKKNLLKKCIWSKRCNVSWEGIDKLCA